MLISGCCCSSYCHVSLKSSCPEQPALPGLQIMTWLLSQSGSSSLPAGITSFVGELFLPGIHAYTTVRWAGKVLKGRVATIPSS